MIPAGERGGFWRRAGAFLIDVLIIVVLLQVAALAAFPLTNGLVQYGGGLEFRSCRRLASPPAELRVPPDFAANYALDCVSTFFGLPVARTVTIGRSTREGRIAKNVWFVFMADADGKPVRGFSMDLLWLPLLFLYRIVLERRNGQTVGKRATRVRVVEGTPGTLRVGAAAKRNLLLLLPFLPALALQAYGSLLPSFSLLSTPFLLGDVAAGLVLSAATLFAAVQIVRRRDAFYDEAAGTAVIVIRSGEPPAAEATAGPPGEPTRPALSIGERVRHFYFGEGTIVEFGGDEALVQFAKRMQWVQREFLKPSQEPPQEA